MFSKPRAISQQDIQSSQYQAIEQLLAPLQRTWPAIHVELVEACTARYEPTRLGEVLAFQFTQLMEKIQKEYDSRQWIIERDCREELRKLRAQDEDELGILKRQKHQLEKEVEELRARVKVLDQKVDTQNKLITNQYQQIQNLTGTSTRE